MDKIEIGRNEKAYKEEKERVIGQRFANLYSDKQYDPVVVRNCCAIINNCGKKRDCKNCDIEYGNFTPSQKWKDVTGLTGEILGKAINPKSSNFSSFVNNLKRGKSIKKYKEKIIKIFGEDLYNKYLCERSEKGDVLEMAPFAHIKDSVGEKLNVKNLSVRNEKEVTISIEDDEVFETASIVRSRFYCREEEFKILNEMVEKNGVTIICADGGVGKTVLANEFLRSLEENKKEKFSLFQTILFSEQDEFDENYFLNKINLTDNTRGALKKLSEGNSSEKEDNIKNNFIKKKLKEIKEKTPIFLLDDFTLVDESIFLLEQTFPNCKFIVTTRNVEGIKGLFDDKVIKLEYFSKEQALEVFNHISQDEFYKAPIIQEEFVSIYEWCEGNAEVLTYIAHMIGGRPIDNFNKFLDDKTRTFETKNKKSGEKENRSMAKRLSILFGFDELLPNLTKKFEDLKLEEKNYVKALAVLTLTGMFPIDRESLLQFLAGEEGSEDKANDCLIQLEKRGIIKPDGKSGVFMHPLMVNALELNDIAKHYNDEICAFVGLITDDNLFLDGCGILDAETLYLPNGIKSIQNYVLYRSNAQTIVIPKTVVEIFSQSFNGCKNLENIIVSGQNKKYTSIDGNLCSKDGKKLLMCATKEEKEEFVIPDCVETIGEFAFDSTNFVNKIIITSNVSKIETRNFKCGMEFEVVEDNKHFKIVDGSLYTVSGEEIYLYSKDSVSQLKKDNEEIVRVDIVDVLLDEENTAPIYMYNDRGEQILFDQIAVIPYGEDDLYCILKPLSDIPGIRPYEAIVFKVGEDDNGDGYLRVEENEEIARKIFDQYYNLIEEEHPEKMKELKKGSLL